MHTFKNNDLVYWPTLSNKLFIVYTKPEINGLFLSHRDKEYWFTLQGVETQIHVSNKRALPSLFAVTESNRQCLNTLYDIELHVDTPINLYAIAVAETQGSPQYWVANTQATKYGLTNKFVYVEDTANSVKTLIANNVLVTNNKAYLTELIEDLKIYSNTQHFGIILVATTFTLEYQNILNSTASN